MSLSNRLGLLGRKVGMMRIFTDDGDAVPVTVLDVSNNRVTQVKTEATDGYSALQVAFGSRKASRVNKPEAGHLAKAGVEAGEITREFRVGAEVRRGQPRVIDLARGNPADIGTAFAGRSASAAASCAFSANSAYASSARRTSIRSESGSQGFWM